MDGNNTDNKDPTRLIWLEAIPTLYPYQPDNKDPTRLIWLEAIPTLYPYQPDNKDPSWLIWLEAIPTLHPYQPDSELEAIFQPCTNFILVSIAGKHTCLD
jgi:hypothetical protein